MADPVIVAPVVVDAADKPWFDGADPEIVGHFQNRGLSDKTASVAAIEMAKAHRAAEALIGLPAERLIRLPADAGDSEGWRAVHQRLGVPKEATDYDFSTVKIGDQPLAADLSDSLRAVALKANVSKDGAVEVAKAVATVLDTRAKAAESERLATLTTARETLKASWGANFEGNMFVAKNAAAALEVSPEAIAALEASIGYDKVMQMFRNIGAKIGEDKFVSNINPNLPGVKTREQAVAEKADLMNDTAWRDRYLAGGRDEVRHMTALNTMIVQGA